MAQGSRQIQSQAQQQVQTLSPQQILVVKLLELPAVELEDRIHAELLENPALEEGREESAADEYSDVEGSEDGMDNASTDYDSLNDYLTEDDIPDYKLQENNRSQDDQPENIPFSESTSFYEILKEQLGERNLTEHQNELVEYLIGSLDDDGLLRKSLESICDELAIYAGVESTEEELEEALCILQDFDPAGIGARTLQECLLLQICRKKDEERTPNPILELEERVIRDYYEEFTRKHWEKIIRKLDVDEDTFNEVISEITKLNPRPGASLGETIGRNFQQIIPDFIVETYDDGTINVSLNNRNVPELRMSRDFTEMVEEHTKNKFNQTKESKEAMMFLKQKMDASEADAFYNKYYSNCWTNTWSLMSRRTGGLDEADNIMPDPMLRQKEKTYVPLQWLLPQNRIFISLPPEELLRAQEAPPPEPATQQDRLLSAHCLMQCPK